MLAVVTVPLLQHLPVWMMRLAGQTDSLADVLQIEMALAALIILPPTVLIGAMFPVLLRVMMGARQHAGSAVGCLYAWNTFGSIGGTVTASFVLLPCSGCAVASSSGRC